MSAAADVNVTNANDFADGMLWALQKFQDRMMKFFMTIKKKNTWIAFTFSAPLLPGRYEDLLYTTLEGIILDCKKLFTANASKGNSKLFSQVLSTRRSAMCSREWQGHFKDIEIPPLFQRSNVSETLNVRCFYILLTIALTRWTNDIYFLSDACCMLLIETLFTAKCHEITDHLYRNADLSLLHEYSKQNQRARLVSKP